MKQRRRISAACFLSCIASQLGLAQTQNATPPATAPIYDFGSQVVPPQLIPFAGNPPVVDRCAKELDGKVVLSLEIDTAGMPQRITFVKPHSDGLDQLAVQVATADRFNPGTVNGAPVRVNASLELRFQGCLWVSTDPATAGLELLRMRAWPEQALGKPAEPKLPPMARNGAAIVNKGVTIPIPINEVLPPHSPEDEHFTGQIQVSILVDEHGLPQNPRVIKGADKNVDDVAVANAMSYRFRPALKDGNPVPVTITVLENFR